ncbi:MAG: hypothetical protein J0I20_09455 [Chloroflexi bacterium]|nr:hypothetical protein [Chloroflexota bacterium]OJV94663.1 MAG: hypothetical protein BGO39_23360 [Chloroflexi bacterium 54-19]
MAKYSKILAWIVSIIALLAIIAAGLGVFWQGSDPHTIFVTQRGQTVDIQGSGLYKYDSVSLASQGIAQDVVTLFMGVPLLLISLWLYQKSLLRGKLMLAGTLAYFLYTYILYAFNTAFNVLFLDYVALSSLSLFAFILTLMSVDVAGLPEHFTGKLPRKSIITFLFISASFLLVAWLGRIVPAYFDNKPPVGLENATTLGIQVMDLGLIVPVGYLGGYLLLKRSAWGYLISAIMLFKVFTLGTALCAMIIGQFIAGVEMALVEVIIFPLLALAGIVLTLLLLINLKEARVGESVNERPAELILQK